MRAIPIASVIVCVVAMMCAALFCSPRPTPPDPDGAADYLDPDPASRHVLVRSYAKDVVAREVIAGRMALPDAAARFGWLNALPPAAAPTLPPELLAALVGLPAGERYGEGEVLALQVVAWVRRPVLSDDPVRSQEAALRQFREARAEGRLARLPEVPEDERVRLLAQAEAEVAARDGSHPGEQERDLVVDGRGRTRIHPRPASRRRTGR